MEMKVGCDIVYIRTFQNALEKHPEKFQRDIFCDSELENSDPQHLAGIFAAKEAVMKALDMRPGLWKLIEIKKMPSGKPYVVLAKKISKDIRTSDISVSHQGEYVVAVAVFLLDR